jgi:hypothetical protein
MRNLPVKVAVPADYFFVNRSYIRKKQPTERRRILNFIGVFALLGLNEEETMQTQEKKCAHEKCTCPAIAGSDFCSPACQSSQGKEMVGCDCGHTTCEGARVAAA